MIKCEFEDGGSALLRHVVTNTIAIKDGKLLLVKRSMGLLEGGKWALPGGYVNRDENIAQAALRELREETGFLGKIEYLLRINSSPKRPRENMRQNIAFEFVVSLTKLVGTPDEEQTETAFFTFDQINALDIAFDHKETINDFEKHLKEEQKIPIII